MGQENCGAVVKLTLIHGVKLVMNGAVKSIYST
jgi:hypothetical protein